MYKRFYPKLKKRDSFEKNKNFRMNYDIAVVIPILNESQIVENSLSSFSAQADKNIIFVIVDNESSDSTVSTIKRWQRSNRNINLKLLLEKKKGVLFAKRRGLEYSKKLADVVVSTDIDNWPLENFYANIRTIFNQDPSADILRGKVRYEPLVRLQKLLFLPELMSLIAWQEDLEQNLFGPFFFGGYFGVKSSKINKTAFPIRKVPLPYISSIFWSRHCYYLGYSFKLSKPDMRSSNRRFWFDPYGSVSGERQKQIRKELKSKKSQEKIFIALRENQHKLIKFRQKYFAERLLMFLLDAVFFERDIERKAIVSEAVDKSCEYLELNPLFIRKLTKMNFNKAKAEILRDNKDLVLKKISGNYLKVVD